MAPWRGRAMVCEIGDRVNPALWYIVNSNEMNQSEEAEEKSELSKSPSLNGKLNKPGDDKPKGESSSLPKPRLGNGKKEKPPREPKCTRCKNHGSIVKVKDHKDDCPRRTCLCFKCIKTALRQRDMKVQTRFRRKVKKDERLMRLPKNPDTPPPTPPLGLNLSVNAPTVTAPPPEPEKRKPPAPAQSQETDDYCSRLNLDESLLDCTSRMIMRMGYSWETFACFFIMLKYCKMEPDLVLKLLMEDATSEVIKILLDSILEEILRHEAYSNCNFQILTYVTVI